MTARAALHELLEPLLPAEWHVLPYSPTPGTIGRVSVYMGQTRVKKNAVAPKVQDDTTITLVLIEPTITPPTADDQLDDNLDVLLDVLDRLKGTSWEQAERATFDSKYPAYEIPITFLTSRKDR